ncbi:hypothetical protein Y032_0359g3424 [Ancylostoma ceylanicum]|uniref:RRM domain-containing protein n=1 Tax=Ancylostoma ceylanicum TaxID=53326 RepID=A0A016RVY3_9BILA|nr:hypothetical protein Y032_0359g3424 [Ancylostoma ceylanicum]
MSRTLSRSRSRTRSRSPFAVEGAAPARLLVREVLVAHQTDVIADARARAVLAVVIPTCEADATVTTEVVAGEAADLEGKTQTRAGKNSVVGLVAFLQINDSDDFRCLGCFNLSVYTTEKDLRELFGEFGEIEKVELVYDHPTGRSRGFGFVYFERLEDACAARDKLTGQEIDGHKIRVDFSLTKRAHTPTPGQYMGAVRGSRRNYGYGSGGYRSERRESYRDGYAGRSSR